MTHSFGFKVPPASFSLGNSQRPATCGPATPSDVRDFFHGSIISFFLSLFLV